jgi:hypothetical protein
MDPYLEGEMWQEFHSTLANAIRGQILAALPPAYTALLAKRYVLDQASTAPQDRARVIYPDVHIAKIAESLPAYATTPRPAPIPPMLAPSRPIRMVNPVIVTEKIPVLSIEVRDVARRRLVTLIEILSPANKRDGGAADYWRRRRELLKRKVHLLELDLLRGGERVPLWGELPPAAYYIMLSRANDRPTTEVWPVALTQPLPPTPVPLLPPDADLTLDLQGAVNACYDLVHYERLLDYTAAPPLPPLAADELAWAEAILQAAGLRPTPASVP